MSETMELAEVRPAEHLRQLAVQPQPQTPMAIMTLAMQQGAPIETIERMWALHVAFEKREAEKAFADAMAEFKKNPPKIVKDKHVHFEGSKGSTDYDHATHYGVTNAIITDLAKHGISHRWVPDQSDGKVGITCVLTHKLGHSESTRLESAPDASGGKNSIQAVMSAKTYLERHSLLAATGLSTANLPDDDGRGAGPALGKVTEAITDALLADLAKTTTDADAAALWRSGSKSLHATGIVQAYEEFKAAVVAHRRKLAEGKA